MKKLGRSFLKKEPKNFYSLAAGRFHPHGLKSQKFFAALFFTKATACF
jgi:hypothetical protein